MWKIIARILARPAIAQRIIAHAKRTPDEHLPGYMDRYWLFNPYDRETRRAKYPRIPFSIRVHHILREDWGADEHDHPWNFRTIILDGAYVERRGKRVYLRQEGDTATLRFGEFHKINMVSVFGVWTLVIIGRYRGKWGFLRDGVKINHKEYLARYPR